MTTTQRRNPRLTDNDETARTRTTCVGYGGGSRLVLTRTRRHGRGRTRTAHGDDDGTRGWIRTHARDENELRGDFSVGVFLIGFRVSLICFQIRYGHRGEKQRKIDFRCTRTDPTERDLLPTCTPRTGKRTSRRLSLGMLDIVVRFIFVVRKIEGEAARRTLGRGFAKHLTAKRPGIVSDLPKHKHSRTRSPNAQH